MKGKHFLFKNRPFPPVTAEGDEFIMFGELCKHKQLNALADP